jgi:trans-aconitate 2-methyltransferase
MDWNPDVYRTYAAERTRPAADLLARVSATAPARVIDLGCGPGNSTALLVARWPAARVEGLESSPDMLATARQSGVDATWTEGDVASWSPVEPYDVVFSNATLHWIANHRTLIPRLRSFVRERGVLAFQVPRNFDAPSHVLMREVAAAGPWASQLAAVGRVNVEEPQTYFDLLSPVATSIDIWETTYVHVLDGDDAVLGWVSGTGLRPFVQSLDPADRAAFTAAYRERLREAYPRRSDGKTLFPFKRLFVVAHDES